MNNKNFGWIVFLFIFWMFLTLILTLSFIGWVVVLPNLESGEKSTWMRMGMDLKDTLIKHE